MNKEELLTLYDKLKVVGQRAIEKHNYKFSLDCISGLSYIAYTFGFRYTDDEVEEMLNKISQQIKRKETPRGAAGPHRCVMIDSLSEYHGGLTVQYLRAIKAAGWDVLYLSDTDLNQRHRAELRKELSTNPRMKVVAVPRLTRGLKRCQFMYDAIIDFNPDSVIVHISPDAAYPAMVCYALPPQIKKFLINYTDHSFLLGTGCVDRSFEFTNYGASISWRYRHIEESNMFMLPYYSFSDDVPFKGLPPIADGKTVIFSGGNYWKITDDQGTFFMLVKRILDVCPNAVVLFAGAGNDIPVKKFIKQYGIDERFVLLGWRNDIAALFDHCDICLSTYPYPGGLMSQFAARAGKPVLAYDPEMKHRTETLTCQVKQIDISKHNIDDLLSDANRLVADVGYRQARGAEIRSCVLSIDDFNKKFKMAVEKDVPTGIPYVIDRTIGPKTEQFIDDNIKLRAHNGAVENQMVYCLGFKASKILPWPVILQCKIKQIRQYWNLVINYIKKA